MKLMEIEEGAARIRACVDENNLKGPSTSATGFYNPAMKFNRDLSVSICKTFDVGTALDGLAATGIRGIRLIMEGAADEVTFNDINPQAVEMIRGNLAINNIAQDRYRIRNDDVLLANIEDDFDYIDIDPYGSPVQFIDTLIQKSGWALQGLSATDTAPLAGTYPKTCRRRYMSNPIRAYFGHETGLRILLGYMARIAATYRKKLLPKLSYYSDHYFRVYTNTKNGSPAYLKEVMGYLIYNRKTEERYFFHGEPWDIDIQGEYKGCEVAGPMWLGPLCEDVFLHRIKPINEQVAGFVNMLKGENPLSPIFYDVNVLAGSIKWNTPPILKFIDTIKSHGYMATRTHFLPTGVRTNAPLEELKSIIRGTPVA